MNEYEDIGRWPPVYDSDDLAGVIKKLIRNGDILKQFYRIPTDQTADEFYQGDVVKYTGSPCYIDESGDISVFEQQFEYWAIIGNTCDLSRTMIEAKHTDCPHLTHVTPLIPLDKNTPAQIYDNLKNFKLFKRMIFPAWNGEQEYFINFTIISSIEKKCLVNNASVVARLMRNSWFLFHACLVRYLARDDGRNE